MPAQPGSAARDILRLAVPAFGALVAQPLFTIVDAAIVGTLGTTSLAALGAAGQIFTTIVGLAIFLAYGTTAVVSRRVGAGQTAAGITAGVSGMALGLGLGVVLAIALWATGPSLLAALGTSAAATPQALSYLQVIALGMPFALVAMAGIGVLRGLADTATTLWITLAAVTLNAALAAYLVLVAGRGVAGSAWATVAAEALQAGAYSVVIARRARGVAASLRPAPGGVIAAARDAVPLFLRTAALRAVFVVAIAVAARMGDAQLASYYVTFTIWYLLALGMDALAIAGQALLGRHLGSGQAALAREVAWQVMRWGVALGIVLMVVLIPSSAVLPQLFGADPNVRALTAAALVVVAAQQPLAGVVFTLDGVLLGAGDNTFLAWASLAALAGSVPALALAGSVTGIWLALTLFLALRAAGLVWRVRGTGWMVLGAVR